MRAFHGNVMSSTGGPNTLVAAKMTKEISDAVQLSAMIENSGQCTALRHACVGGATEADMKAMFENAPTISSPQDALRNGAFAGVFDNTGRLHHCGRALEYCVSHWRGPPPGRSE